MHSHPHHPTSWPYTSQLNTASTRTVGTYSNFQGRLTRVSSVQIAGNPQYQWYRAKWSGVIGTHRRSRIGKMGAGWTQEVVLSWLRPWTDVSHSAFDNSFRIFLRKDFCNFRCRRFAIECFLLVWTVRSLSEEATSVINDKVSRFCYSVECELFVNEWERKLLVTKIRLGL